MKRTVAVVGLSGVGKSTAITLVAADLPLVHLQASDLIKQAQAFHKENISSSEQLRLGAVHDNQKLLIEAFRHSTVGFEGLIIFDGHAMIDGRDGLVEIPSEVFRNLACDHVLALEDEAAQILERRRTDVRRVRPLPSLEALDEQQRRATCAAARIASDLGVGLTVLRIADVVGIRAVLTGAA